MYYSRFCSGLKLFYRGPETMPKAEDGEELPEGAGQILVPPTATCCLTQDVSLYLDVLACLEHTYIYYDIIYMFI